MSTGSSITFRGGNIVSDGPFNLNGSGALRINCDVVSATTTCPRRSGHTVVNGTADMSLEGIFFAPNASLELGATPAHRRSRPRCSCGRSR